MGARNKDKGRQPNGASDRPEQDNAEYIAEYQSVPYAFGQLQRMVEWVVTGYR
jgi:hypothetical protein